jgi:hypothetical protein
MASLMSLVHLISTACNLHANLLGMKTTNIQIRGVPVGLHQRVKRRASKQGKSMSDYLLSLIERDLAIPTPSEFARRLARMESVVLDRPAAHDIEEIRRARDEELDPTSRGKARSIG